MNASKQYFEFYYKNKCYTLNEVTKDGSVYTQYFLDLDEAKEYGKNTDEHSTVYIFKTRVEKKVFRYYRDSSRNFKLNIY